jgi:hypothetical protein
MASRSIRTWFLAALVGAAPAACLFSPVIPDGPCKTNEDACDDSNPCTVDTCKANGFCDNEDDDGLVPDDGNPCTNDTCKAGTEQHANVADGTGCGLNDMLQCLGGKCNCSLAAECGVDEDCLKFACTDQACQTINVAEGTVINGAGSEDCLKNACDGAGKVALVPDLMDYPSDPTPGDCTRKGCSAEGTVINVPEVNDLPSDATLGDCMQPSCSAAGVLGEEPDITDVPTDNPPGDCKKPSCDATGNPIDIEDAADLPADDSNVCTVEGCNGTTPIDHEPVADNTPCGAGAKCEAAGSGFEQTSAQVCQAGACLNPVISTCDLYKCNGTACFQACGGNGDCVAGSYCTGGQCVPVAGLGIPCMNDAGCASGQCADGVCCNVDCMGLCQTCALAGQLGVCSNIPAGTDPANECADPQACSGGECKNPNGETCAAGADCVSGICEDGVCCNATCGGDCKRCNLAGSVGSCEDVPVNQTSGVCNNGSVCNGMGSCKKVNGEPCNGNGDCLSNACPSEGVSQKVCCNTACGGTCQSCLAAKTGGTTGTCGNITSGANPDNDCAAGQVCNGAGVCKKVNGQSCSSLTECLSGFCPSESGQDICCNSACNSTCVSCKASYTGGADGTCGNVLDKTDPNDDCSGTCDPQTGSGCCDGTGMCK